MTANNKQAWDFPGASVVKNWPANAGDTGLIPGPEIPHAVGQLSSCATTTKPGTLEPVSHVTHSNEDPEQPK